MIKKEKDAGSQKRKGEIKERCKWVWLNAGSLFLPWEGDIRAERRIFLTWLLLLNIVFFIQRNSLFSEYKFSAEYN